jgi:adenosine kinase
VRLVVTGSIAYDYLMTFPGRFAEHLIADKLDKISVSFLVDTMEKRWGGCAANIAYGLGLLGEKPLLVGSVGQDFSEYRSHLESAGVDTSGVLVKEDVFTASFFANTDLAGNQICSFYTGAMRFAGEISLRSLGVQSTDRVIISPNDPDAMIHLAHECREIGVPFIFDPSQQIARLDGPALKSGAEGASILILNEYELEMFKQKTGLSDPELLRLSQTVIVTLGERGTQIRTQTGVIDIPAVKPKEIVDPTGVGDAFRAGIMKGLSHGLSWEASGRMGSLAAAYGLETKGGQGQVYTLAEFIDRFEMQFGKVPGIQNLRA